MHVSIQPHDHPHLHHHHPLFSVSQGDHGSPFQTKSPRPRPAPFNCSLNWRRGQC
uniref:Uncharacterized protein n=1 Tax=Anguilla anguilla TaxID=7936 RepID=A0A0E9QMU3_ANGAN